MQQTFSCLPHLAAITFRGKIVLVLKIKLNIAFKQYQVMKKIGFIIIALIGLLPAFTNAQDSTLLNLPKEWSLQYCIQYAKQHNIQISTLRLNTNSAQEDLLQANAAKLPNLSASVGQSLVNSNNVNVVVGGLQTQANFSSSYGVSSSLTLYNGGYLKNEIGRASCRERVSSPV